MPYLLQFDGAAEPNPGPAGGAYVIFSPIQTDENGDLIRILLYEGFYYMPHATNNEAEYTGLILGLKKALEVGIEAIEVEGDSNLVVQQVQGKWKVKVPRLVPFQSKANKLIWKFKQWSLKHIPREENADADRLSKEALEVKEEVHREY
jgi:ribonuclease HI